MRIGILGSGQLARMTALGGYSLGLEFRFFGPDLAPCAAQVGECIVAEYNDYEALQRFADQLDVVTYEFENVPAATVEFLEKWASVRPGGKALFISQNRLREKEFFTALSVPVTEYAKVDSVDDLQGAVDSVGTPAILKTCQLGYDGKGQAVVATPTATMEVYKSLGMQECVLERVVAFDRELSLISVRSTDGQIAHYPLCENWHREGILRKTVAPARSIALETQRAAESMAVKIMTDLNYVGVLTIEFFQVGENLIVNEMAPRVHNSGHWTIEGAETSQFENHVRAVAGLPLGSTRVLCECVMLNCIGSMPDRRAILQIEGAHFHAYGKSARPNRKVGHITLTQRQTSDSVAVVEKLAALLESSEGGTGF